MPHLTGHVTALSSICHCQTGLPFLLGLFCGLLRQQLMQGTMCIYTSGCRYYICSLACMVAGSWQRH